MERTPQKNLGMTLLHWLLFLAAAGVGALVQLAFSTDTETSDGSGFLPIRIYEAHPLMFPVGTAIMIAALVWAWIFLFRQDLTISASQPIGWQIAWWALWLIGCFAVFMGYLFIMMYLIGLFSRLKPDFCEAWMFVYPAAVLLTAVISRIIIAVKRRNGSA